MENEEVSQKEIVTFFYQKSTRRLRRLESNVFVIYFTILQPLSNYGLKLLNSNTISQEFNSNIQNFLTVNENDLP